MPIRSQVLTVAFVVVALTACESKQAPASAATPAPVAAPAYVSPAPLTPTATRYVFSQVGSKVAFVGAKITGNHLGSFGALDGVVDIDGDNARVDVQIALASVTSDSAKLTKHLRGADFFDADKMPTAHFTSTEVKRNADGTRAISGTLKLHGVEKPFTFNARVDVTADTVTAHADAVLNRKDFGIVYPGKPDDLIKDDVPLTLDIVAKKAP